MPAQTAAPEPTCGGRRPIVICAGASATHYLRDLWSYREVLYTLARRDLSVRYKQTALGIAWAIIQPLSAVVILAFVFGRLVGLRPDAGSSYAAMVVAAMLPWQLFSNILSTCGQSMLGNANLITKVYFPRLLVPLAALSVALVDFGIMTLLFLPYLIWQGASVNLAWLAIPPLVALAALAALGPALFVAALSVKYRDFRFLVPFFLQIGLFLSPVAYSSSLVREKLGPLVAHIYSLNPLVPIIDSLRHIFGTGPAPVPSEMAVSLGVTTLFLLLGFRYFRKVEKNFADII